MRVFAFYRQKPGLAMEISGRVAYRGFPPQSPKCFNAGQPKRPGTKLAGLAAKMNDRHSAEKSVEPYCLVTD